MLIGVAVIGDHHADRLMSDWVTGGGWAWVCLEMLRYKAVGSLELHQICVKSTWSWLVILVGHCREVGCRGQLIIDMASVGNSKAG